MDVTPTTDRRATDDTLARAAGARAIPPSHEVIRRLASLPSRLLALVSVLLSLYATCAMARDCITYGPSNLEGRLAQQTFAGPPDYEDVTRGDAAQVIWVLLLDEPACVEGDPRSLPERVVREIELVLAPEQSARWRLLLGKRVIVSGELAHGGALNQKRVVLITREIERVRLGPGTR